jgi:hypothetical protein
MNDDELRAKNLIVDQPPTKIFWTEVKSIYDQFNQLNTPDGIRKRGVITNELKNLERQILQGLR